MNDSMPDARLAARRAVTKKSIEELRKRLLDLSKGHRSVLRPATLTAGRTGQGDTPRQIFPPPFSRIHLQIKELVYFSLFDVVM